MRNSVSEILRKAQNLTQWVNDRAIKTAQAIVPIIEKLGKAVTTLYIGDAPAKELADQPQECDDTEITSTEGSEEIQNANSEGG